MAIKRIYKRKDGRYVVRRMENGKTVAKYFHTADAARLYAQKINAMINANEPIIGEPLCIWAGACVDAYARNLSLDTVNGYKSIIRNHIENAPFARLMITEIRPFAIQQWVDDMAETLSPKTVRNVFGCLHWILQKAVENRYIAQNPTTGVILPQRTRPKRKVLTPAMAKRLLEAMQDSPDYSLWLFIAATGCRLSEALGMPVENINLITGEYKISQTVTVNPETHRAVIQKRTKTANAARTGIVPQPVLRHISATITANKEHKLSAGLAWRENGLIWCDAYGRPWKRNTILGRYRNAQSRIGIPPELQFGAHAFRHLVATQLLRSNISDAAVARQLGHYSPAYTRTQYMDAYDFEQQEIAEKMGDMLNFL